MKCMIIVSVLALLAGLGGGNPWLYQDPDFLQGSNFYPSAFQPGSVTPLEVVASPYFSLLGQGFDYRALPRSLEQVSNATELGSNPNVSFPPLSISFDGFEEKSLNYARSKSSLRVAQDGTWTPLDFSGLL
jgi:hypothetical protein